ncbi:MAG TPA: hypothetical protein VGG34_04085 [Opitutaceae bacterium]|jgi:hypothetical protein
MAEEPKPEPLRLAAEPRRYDSVDTPSRPGDGTAISVRLIHAKNWSAQQHPPASVGEAVPPAALPPGFAPRSIEAVNPAPGADDAGAITVDQILRQNRAGSGEPALLAPLPARPSRRRQDFLIILAGACVSAAIDTLVFHGNPAVQVMLLVAIGFVTIVLTWFIYGMMDKY